VAVTTPRIGYKYFRAIVLREDDLAAGDIRRTQLASAVGQAG
jgi:hypothetical protein